MDANTLHVDTAHSRGALDRDERQVKDAILRMASLVEEQIRRSIRAFVERDQAIAAEVIETDARVNESQRTVTDAVAMTIATQSPVARDLRFLLALNHVALELERMGDHATSVAKQVRRLADDPPIPGLSQVGKMGSLAADLVRGIMDALIDVDQAKARAIAQRDDEIDHLYRDVFSRTVTAMQADPSAVERGARLILAAHWIERIGDRVTNIAEDVVYLSTGLVEDLN